MCHCEEFLCSFTKYLYFPTYLFLLFIVKINLNDMYILSLAPYLQNWNTYLIQIFTYEILCFANFSRILVYLDTFFFNFKLLLQGYQHFIFFQKAQLFFFLSWKIPLECINLYSVQFTTVILKKAGGNLLTGFHIFCILLISQALVQKNKLKQNKAKQNR